MLRDDMPAHTLQHQAMTRQQTTLMVVGVEVVIHVGLLTACYLP